MLRLWPDRRLVAVFPDRAWAYAGEELLLEPVSSPDDSLLNAVGKLLQRIPAPVKPRTRIDMLLSDEVARTVLLPWQDGLRTEAQQRRYAEMCLEEVGISENGWTIQHHYRRYQQSGLAYAVPTETLHQLAGLVEARGMKLRSVLPVVAAAYWRQGPVRQGSSLVILAETRRIAALHFSPVGLAGLDVQPITASHEMALRRLLRRLQLQTGEIVTVAVWCADTAWSLAAIVDECYPAAQLKLIAHGSLG